jgi:uncharacterized membrane protein
MMPGRMASKRTVWTTLAYVAWLALVGVLALLSLVDLIASIVESDSGFERNPGALIVLAAITATVCTAAVAAVVRCLTGRGGGLPPTGALVLTLAALALTLIYVIASIASGPL